MLDNLTLVHMNGRVYDPVVGRFLSADPIVQAPGFTQSFNRYAYTFNNPLSFVDPSGFKGRGVDEHQLGGGGVYSGGSRIVSTGQFGGGRVPGGRGGSDAHGRRQPPQQTPAPEPTPVEPTLAPESPVPQPHPPDDRVDSSVTGVPCEFVQCQKATIDVGQPPTLAGVTGILERLAKELAESLSRGTNSAAVTPSVTDVDIAGLDRPGAVVWEQLPIVVAHLITIAAAQGHNFIDLDDHVFDGERAMVARLALGFGSSYDYNFLHHEVAEAQRTAELMAAGMDLLTAQNTAHSQVLSEAGVKETDLYHPKVVATFPEVFNESFPGFPR
jgi:RHS repeat-associated protein